MTQNIPYPFTIYDQLHHPRRHHVPLSITVR